MRNLLLLFITLLFIPKSTFAQTKLIGAENFSVSLPQQFKRTIGNNDLAVVQWEHFDKEIYGYVLFENIDELKIAKINHDLAFYADFALNDFSDYTNYKLIQARKYTTISGKETEEREFTYDDEENNIHFHTIINVYKTAHFIYKMINFGSEETFNEGKKEIEYIINQFQLP